MLQGVGTAGIAGIVGTQPAGAKGRDPLDRHIVGVDPGKAGEAKRRADAVHRVLDFEDIGQAVSGWFTQEAREALANNPNVQYIEEEGTVEAIGQDIPWGIDRVDADVAHSNGETGNGADIAIIDTGIDDDHPDLKANVGAGTAYTSCQGSNCNEDWSDDNDHGTHCAGIADAVDNGEGVVGVATEATLHAVKVLDENGSGYWSDVAAGIEYTADQGWDVGSMSLGASSGSSTVKNACQYASDKGVLLVGAAGNDGPCSDCVGYPAAYSTVVAVSSTENDDELSDFSSTGPEVELAAPGTYIYSTIIGGYETFSGTSMACPHVSGAGGQLMANGYTNTEARNRLNSTAEDIGLSDNDQGNGLLDVEAALADSSDTSVAVSTDSATSVGETSVTLNGSLDDLGGADSADCYFKWRQVGADTWTATATQTLSSTGSFSEDLTGLEDGVDYEYRAVGDASDGDTDTGTTVSFTTTDDPPAVTTESASNVTATSATLNGSLDDMGNASSIDCYFEYRESGTSTWSTTSTQTLSATGSVSQDISGLSSGTDYEYRTVADASDGDTATGSAVTFSTTSSDTSVAVSTDAVSSVGTDTATLNGSLTDLGGASSADVHFEWHQVGASTWNTTSTQTLSATGSFSESISGLSSGTDYEYRAVADASDGDTDTGTTVSFTTDSGSTAPAIDSYTVTEAGSPNPHAEITADWAVSDADGDLDSVLVEVFDSSETVVDSAQTNVSGGSVSGTDKWKLKHRDNETFDVRLTVTDATGNSTTQTKTVSS
ncbi:MAG: S8 family serine peptidase [Haloarculaceae archaeon]